MTKRFTRRRALQAGAVGLAFGLAGCSDGDGEGTDEETETETETPTPTPTPTPIPPPKTGPIGPIPAEVTAIARADAQALLDGALFTELDATPLPGIGDASSALDDIESEFGLDPEQVSTLTAFQSTLGNGSLSGIVVEAGWSDAALSGIGGETTTYRERTIYSRDSGLSLGVLGGDQYAIGQLSAVQAIIAVAVGDEEPATGSVVSGLQNGPEGRAQFAVGGSQISVPEGTFEDGGLQARLAKGFIDDISLIAGALAADGENRTLTVEIEATEDSAPGLAGILAQGPSFAGSFLDEETRSDPNVQTLLTAFEETAVNQEGPTITLVYSKPVDEFAATIRAAAAVAAGSNGPTDGSETESSS